MLTDCGVGQFQSQRTATTFMLFLGSPATTSLVWLPLIGARALHPGTLVYTLIQALPVCRHTCTPKDLSIVPGIRFIIVVLSKIGTMDVTAPPMSAI